jgi:hypothetical protein
MRSWWAARRLRTKVILVVVALLLALSAISPKAAVTPASTGSVPSTASASSAPAASFESTTSVIAGATGAPGAAATPGSAPAPRSTVCISVNGLPDHNCTPGVADPRVTQANIATTICVSGYTTTVRPPTSYTDPLKVQQMALYGETGSTADYEEDHLIALEVGGDPRDPKNLWPEPRNGSNDASTKDTLENRLHAEVCAGAITLAAAQQCIAVDWVACAATGADSRTSSPTEPAATIQPTPAATAEPTAPPPTPPPSPPTTASPAPATAVTFTFVSSPVARNANATATVQTTPTVGCTIVVTYNSGPSTAAGLAPKTADAYGIVSWTWKVGGNTALGTYPIRVTCAGVSAAATFTVL